jgi:hypothetical protein
MTRARSLEVVFLAIGVVMLILCSPRTSHAQNSDISTLLRAQIKAEVLADPRSVKLTTQELADLVNALAGQAESQGLAYDFIPAPQVLASFAASGDSTLGMGGTQLSEGILYGVILFSLSISMIALRRVLELHTVKQENLASGSPQ